MTDEQIRALAVVLANSSMRHVRAGAGPTEARAWDQLLALLGARPDSPLDEGAISITDHIEGRLRKLVPSP